MRNYIVASWSDADQYDYSGEMLGGSRHKNRSQRVHFNPDGSACVASYSDPEVKSRISIKDQILPQGKRLTTLRKQMVELENNYRNGEMSISEYSLYRDIVVAKIERQEVLYKRASSVKPVRNDEETEEFNGENDYKSCATGYSYATLQGTDKSSFVDQLSHTNIFRTPLQKALHISKKIVQFMKASKHYIKMLSEV